MTNIEGTTMTAELSEIDRARLAFRQELFDADILVPTGVDGIYGRSATFEAVIAGLSASVNRIAAADNAVSYLPGQPTSAAIICVRSRSWLEACIASSATTANTWRL
jgi:hypothetical protein